jgi:peptide/nickel transport system permease protein
LCLLFLVILAVAAIAPAWMALSDPTVGVLKEARSSPGWSHPFGTDAIGRDVYSRVIHGTRISLSVSVLAVGTGLIVGGALGLVSGYLGGWVDAIVMRFIDVMMAFPGVLLAMAIIAARGRSIDNLILAIGIAAVPDYARLVRGQVLALRKLPFIEGSIASGATPGRIMLRHILPNLLRPVIVFATIGAGFALLASSAFSFIGLGAQPPSPEWGAMLADGRSSLADAWWMGTFPGLAIFLTVISVNVVSQ